MIATVGKKGLICKSWGGDRESSAASSHQCIIDVCADPSAASSLAAGQTINVSFDSATQCQLSVQSFDVFKATLVATCSGPEAK
ncbi:MAG: hypothetical protein WAK55_09440 [Xanthobacteraceae bacterium]